jgi:hypothetical protein
LPANQLFISSRSPSTISNPLKRARTTIDDETADSPMRRHLN